MQRCAVKKRKRETTKYNKIRQKTCKSCKKRGNCLKKKIGMLQYEYTGGGGMYPLLITQHGGNCMFEKIRKLKDRKGFTLVELIVVLVILAILAALLIPALTGYIDKANKEKVIAECRMAVMAVQTESTTIYGKNGKVTAATDFDDTEKAAVRKLAEVSGHWTATVGTDGKVTELVYTNTSWTVTYTAADGTDAASYSEPEKVTTALDKDTYKAS